ncbi:DUF1232 domain-containing protein [uncultured Psychroserpens sp.]|uniref:YkvA family protein n=1 Tax=uncultured Psychroserpens sp. TaxID=255436 RepID=UPI002636A88E|nr:DUF1232 domain-containing protein [uncultured Psychroserpens sp.]
MNTFKNLDYSELLDNNTSDYNGPHQELITNSRHIFDLMVKVLDDPDLPNAYRSKLLSVIGYFILPKDLYPEEEFGAIGYVDDLMAAIFVLKQIEQSNLTTKLNIYWSGVINLEELLNVHFDNLRIDYMELFNELIEYLDI